MKKLILLTLIILPSITAYSATPNATYFVGASLGGREFSFKDKEPVATYDYSDRVFGIHGGFRGNYTQIYLEYIFENKFKDKGVETNFGNYSARFDFYKSLDLFYALAGIKFEYINGSSDAGDFPGGFTPGVAVGFGAFLGNKVSIDYTFTYSFPQSGSKTELENIRLYALNIAYHFSG